ncbi:MAG: CehA/McbA family metallohydrolase [Acidilobaceae archaeon]
MIRADLHIHTIESDGSIEPHEVVSAARARGLDAVAITDHDSFRGALVAQRYARLHEDKVLVLAGAEVTTDWGHIIVLCEKPPRWSSSLPSDPHELRDLATLDNCLLTAPHPFDYTRRGVGARIFREKGFFDGVELWNASSLPVFNLPALLLAERLEASWLASSDAHVLEEVGGAYTLIDSQDRNADSLLEAMRRRRTAPYPGVLGLRARLVRISWSISRRM